jgi:hypothetical protein
MAPEKNVDEGNRGEDVWNNNIHFTSSSIRQSACNVWVLDDGVSGVLSHLTTYCPSKQCSKEASFTNDSGWGMNEAWGKVFTVNQSYHLTIDVSVNILSCRTVSLICLLSSFDLCLMFKVWSFFFHDIYRYMMSLSIYIYIYIHIYIVVS